MRSHLRSSCIAAFACIAVALVGCGSEGSEGTSEDDATAAKEGFPVGPDGKPLPTKLEGTYELATVVDLTEAAVVPKPVAETLTALSKFKEKPAQTIVDLLDAANVPAAGFLNAVPGAIRPSVLGFIDDYIFKAVYDKVPVTKRLTDLLDDVGSVATEFQIVTRLELPGGDGAAKVKASHTLFGLGFGWDGKQHVIEVPQEIRAKVGAAQSLEANAAPLAPKSKDVELGRLQLDKHSFGIPVGTFAVKAIDQLATDRFGADLRGSLGKVIGCDKLAESVASKCIDPFGPGKACVGHADEIEKACTTGLDLLVKTVQTMIKGLDIALDLKVGTAQMWDAPEPNGPVDAVADRIALGFWDGAIRANNESTDFLSTFTGRRVGTAGAPPPSEPVR
jgi:hypothetical protein